MLIIAQGYPHNESNHFVFVEQLVNNFVDSDIHVDVISPQSITNSLFRKQISRPYQLKVKVNSKNYNLFSPKFLSFSNIPILNGIAKLLFFRAVIKTVESKKLDFETIYAHFLEIPGVAAYKLNKKYKKPYFIAIGESKFNFQLNQLIRNTLLNAKGFIAVSNEIKTRILNFDLNINKNKILVAPNGYNPERFYPYNASQKKLELGISDKDFVVIFVGSFIHRKGTLRLNEALKNIGKPEIKAIFIGQGPENPDYEHIIFKGSVAHKDLNDYLNVADIFVLPTLNEGSCNAIIEAIGAGLPVISSALSFNDEILSNNGLRVNSNSVIEIQNAILELHENPEKLAIMKLKSVQESKKFNIFNRTNRILNFIKNQVSS
jgi:glycosyltransferase involved in cell wall biosynthesis